MNPRSIFRKLVGRAPYAEALGLLVLACGLTLPSWLRGRLISHEGLTYNYAHLSFVTHQIRMGNLPLWNPYVVSGSPEIADPTVGFFYPFHIPLFMILSARDALNAGIVLHLVLAGAFMYLYLGSASLSRSGRFLGALVYML